MLPRRRKQLLYQWRIQWEVTPDPLNFSFPTLWAEERKCLLFAVEKEYLVLSLRCLTYKARHWNIFHELVLKPRTFICYNKNSLLLTICCWQVIPNLASYYHTTNRQRCASISNYECSSHLKNVVLFIFETIIINTAPHVKESWRTGMIW